MITIQSFLFQSIPEGIVYSMFVIALAGLRIKPNVLKIFLSGVTLASITIVLWFFELTFFARFLIQMPIFCFVLYFLFKYPFYQVMITSSIGMGILTVLETIVLEIAILITGYPFEALVASNFFRILLPNIGYAILGLIIWMISRKKWSLFRRESDVFSAHRSVNKKVDAYILALTVQILFVVIYNLGYVNGLFQQNNLLFQIVSLAVIILSLLLMYFVHYIIALSEKAGELEAQKSYIKHVNDLFVTIRGQRHDFVNHIQVIHSFMQMKRYDLLEAYVNDLTTEVKEIGKIIIPDNATLSALLQTKSVLFETYNIALEIKMGININKTQMDAIDQVKLIGNLLDNAKEAICEHNVAKGSRKVSLSIVPQDNAIVIKVANTLPLIPSDELQQIFNAGYTTKANHTGIGLAIVQQIVNKYKGKISAASDEAQGTVFTVTIPIPKDEEIDTYDFAMDSRANCQQI